MATPLYWNMNRSQLGRYIKKLQVSGMEVPIEVRELYREKQRQYRKDNRSERMRESEYRQAHLKEHAAAQQRYYRRKKLRLSTETNNRQNADFLL